MSCGTPSIYSNCSGQLEFADGKGLPVKISHELPVSSSTYNHFNENVGNYYEPDFKNLCEVMRNSYENYSKHKEKALKDSEIIRKDFSWENVAKIGLNTINDFMSRKPWLNRPKKENIINITYVDGPKVEILGDEDMEYLVEFIDSSNDEVVHSTTITNNMWTHCNRKYYTDWLIRINGVVQNRFNPKGKRVLISLDSKSIGDTLAWTPYAIEFAKKHDCKVILSTFHNKWFINNPFYKDIDFISPGQKTNCYASYMIGWFRDENGGWEKYDLYPNQVNMIPLQQTASDILGLEFKEVNYGVNLKMGGRPIKQKYVVFGPQATSGCKEWVYDYWVQLSKILKNKGYKVVVLSSSKYDIEGTINIHGKSWDTVATYLWHSEFLVGLGSGLSWFNWALGKFTYMINGFVEEGHEFTKNMKKITKNKCIKCWNDPVHVFDAGDWDWCPVYKGTKLQHTCQKSITPLDVLKELNNHLK
jgi:autotransporter strand-loop-strand O-heptosyltransferase